MSNNTTVWNAGKFLDSFTHDARQFIDPREYGLTRRVWTVETHFISTPREYNGHLEYGGYFGAEEGWLERMAQGLRDRLATIRAPRGSSSTGSLPRHRVPCILIDLEGTPYRISTLQHQAPRAYQALLERFKGDEKAAAAFYEPKCLQAHREMVEVAQDWCPAGIVGLYNAPWSHRVRDLPGEFDGFYENCTGFFPSLYEHSAEEAEYRCRHARQVAGNRQVIALVRPSDPTHVALALGCGADAVAFWDDPTRPETVAASKAHLKRMRGMLKWETIERRPPRDR